MIQTLLSDVSAGLSPQVLLCVEFACSPCVCVGSLGVPMASTIVQRHLHLGRRETGIRWEREREHQLDQEDGAEALPASGSSFTLIF